MRLTALARMINASMVPLRPIGLMAYGGYASSAIAYATGIRLPQRLSLSPGDSVPPSPRHEETGRGVQCSAIPMSARGSPLVCQWLTGPLCIPAYLARRPAFEYWSARCLTATRGYLYL